MPKKYDTTDLTICTDCAMIYANGIDTPEQGAHVKQMLAHTPDMTGTVAVDEISHDFSPRQCDTCGTTLAGERWPVSAGRRG